MALFAAVIHRRFLRVRRLGPPISELARPCRDAPWRPGGAHGVSALRSIVPAAGSAKRLRSHTPPAVLRLPPRFIFVEESAACSTAIMRPIEGSSLRLLGFSPVQCASVLSGGSRLPWALPLPGFRTPLGATARARPRHRPPASGLPLPALSAHGLGDLSFEINKHVGHARHLTCRRPSAY